MADNIAAVFQAERATIEVRLTEAALRLIQREALASAANETGGILIGRYEDDGNTAVVTSATERPADSSSGRTWFKRGVSGLTTKLRARWESGEYYIGEWHSHPGGAANPSSNDMREMRSISINANYKCPKPIMVIAGTSSQRVRISVSVMQNGGLIHLERILLKPATDRSVVAAVHNE